MNAVFSNGELVSSRFQVRGLIGQGDLGQVFEVWDLASSNLAALKQFTGPAARDARVSSAIAESARRASASSPALSKVLHDGTSDHGAYLVTERLGPSLEQHRLAPFQVASAFAPLAAALDAAHSAGIAHGDLHPRNVFPGPDGRIRATDFGVWPQRAASPNPWPGLPGWTAPEIVQGRPPTPRSDVYGFSLVLFYALHGAPCFRSLSTGRVDINSLWSEMNGSIDLLARAQELRSPMNPNVAALLARALAVDPAARPGSVSELLSGLSAASPSGGHAHGTLVMKASELPLSQAPSVASSGSVSPSAELVSKAPSATNRPLSPRTTGVGGTVSLPVSPVSPSRPPQSPNAPPPVNPALRASGTMVADVSAFPELAAVVARGLSQSPGPVTAPPPAVRQTSSPEPAPPPLVDPRSVPQPDAPPAPKDWSTMAFAEAAREEWAKGAAYQARKPLEGPDSRGDMRGAPFSERPRIKPAFVALLAGIAFVVLILALVLLYLVFRMDDSAKFPAPKPNARLERQLPNERLSEK